uniref:Uncharacterized protein n=1 Tax=Arundo donax TaxID=35708 RepID=A0A0A9BGP2_ARUDO
MLRRPLRRHSPHRALSASRLSSASVIAAASCGSTSRPLCRALMMSTGPPFLVATTGRP